MLCMGIYKHHGAYWGRWTDPHGRTRKIRLAGNKGVASKMSKRIDEIREHAICGEQVPDTLIAWAEQSAPRILPKLVAWGFIDERRLILADGLASQIQRWHDGLVARGRTAKYAAMKLKRAGTIAETAGFQRWSEIDAERVLAVVNDWRRDGRVPGFRRRTSVSEDTLAHYLSAFKQFTRWMARSGYAQRDPMAAVRVERRDSGSSGSNMANRRALSADEQRRLVAGTVDLVDRWCVRNGRRVPFTGEDRSLLYRTALQTGLRQSAIRRLLSDNVDAPSGMLMASGTIRGKRSTPKPARGRLLELLTERVALMMPGTPLFILPHETSMARILRADCAALGIDTAGVDFHCLRHTFCTEVGRTAKSVKTAQRLMDHATVAMTMRYMHSWPDDEAAAVEGLPELDAAPNKNMA